MRTRNRRPLNRTSGTFFFSFFKIFDFLTIGLRMTKTSCGDLKRNNSSSSSSISSNETICSESTKSSIADQQRIRLHQEKLKNQQLQQKILELQKQENQQQTRECANANIKLQCPVSPSKPSNPPIWKTQKDIEGQTELSTNESSVTDNFIHGSILYESDKGSTDKAVRSSLVKVLGRPGPFKSSIFK